MAHILADRVREVSTTTGTTDFALVGAVTDFRAFSAVMANGDTCWYAAVLASGGGWEIGIGTWVTGGTLQRTTVLASSAGGTTKVTFGAGSKDIFMTLPGAGILTAAGGTLTGALNFKDYVTVASATTTDIGAAASNLVNISGTTTITGLGTIAAGAMRTVKFAGALTLTHNATSLILPGAANITTAAGDTAMFVSEGSGNWRCVDYLRASGAPVVSPAGDATLNVGYLNIPQNSQSAAYTVVLADAGKHILHPSADTTARTFTIPANSSVAYPIGTAITFINQNAAGVVTIAITTDTMRLAGAGTTGSRTLAANGIATAVKVTSTEWIISGSGLT